jgi:hypothetical protein
MCAATAAVPETDNLMEWNGIPVPVPVAKLDIRLQA